MKWTFPRGAPPELAFDIPPTWIPDRVQLLGVNDALAWHSSIRGDGGTRVTVLVPLGMGREHELTLVLGATSTIHNAGILDLSSNLPLVIELVDTEEKLRTFFGDLEALDDIGLVTLEKVEVIHYG